MLLAVFGLSWAVTIPLIFAACTITGTLGIVYGVASIWATPTYATNLVQLIGLGIAVDYSLLIVYRFREELATGNEIDDAVVRTMQTAGRAVVFSGIAVALGLALLVAMPLPFIRMLGVAGFLIPIVSIVGAVTLQPVLLSLLRPPRHGAPPVLPRRATPTERGLLGAPRPHDHGAAGPRSSSAAPPCSSLMAVPAFWLQLTPGSTFGIPRTLAVGARASTSSGRRSGPAPSRPSQVLVESARRAPCSPPPTQAAVEAARRRARARPRGRQGLHRHRRAVRRLEPAATGRCSSPAATTTASRRPRRS